MNIETADINFILHKYFPQISEPALIKEMVTVGQLLTFTAGEVIMNFGGYIRMVPLVIEGSIKVTRENDKDSNEVLLYYLNSGDSCTMSFTCCMMNKKSIIRTQAIEDTIILGIPIKYMDSWMINYVSWKNFVMQAYDERMVELINVIDSIAFQKVDQRLVQYLKERSEAIGSKVIKITHQQIAFDLNVSREAISRLLKKLEMMDQVQLGRNQVEIK